MTGEIPSELATSPTWTIAVPLENQLTGEIPKELGNLANLLYLTVPPEPVPDAVRYPELGSLANAADSAGNPGGVPLAELGGRYSHQPVDG